MIAKEFTSRKALALSSIQILLFLLASNVFSYERRVYHGIIREDAPPGTEVKLDLQLKPDKQRDVCSYAVFSSLQNFPFKVVQDHKADAVKIILGERFQLDYEKTKEYDFEIETHACSQSINYERESVHVDVIDVYDSVASAWKQRSYYAEVVEGKRYEKIICLNLAADEADDLFDEICSYRILTPDVPFEVDADGFVRNTEPLDYNRKHSYSLEVAVSECSRNQSLVVNIEVKALCKAGWMGVPDRVEFSPREGWKEVAVNAELNLCAGSCNLTRVAVTAILTTGHIGKGCDRDTYSLQSQRKLCGASAETTDLLPNPSGSGWTKNLPTDDGQESDRIFAFDGKSTSVEVPRDRVDPRLGNKFTISTWMKHEDEIMETKLEHDGGTGKGHSGNKGHILCHSDGEGMNRHHYSLHVHNCRLVLLLRRSPGTGVDMESLEPGEWRWRLPEVCDKKWHHYVIAVDLPVVELYVDGRKFTENKHNPEILTHGPLHASKHVHSTKLVVGACWMGGKGHMGHYFHGYLAGLSVLRNETETDDVIRCLNNCQEKLNIPGIDDMENGMTVSMNTEMTSITISGVTVDSVQRLLRRITYVNSRTFPTPGHRPFALETRATCSDGKSLPVEDVKTLIMVLEPEKPMITLDAARVVEEEEHRLERGGKIFRNLTISAFTRTEAGEQTYVDDKDFGSSKVIDSGDRYLLDSCLIRVNPPLNLDVEHIRYPENLLRQLRMEADVSEEGLVITGADKLVNYVEVMQDVRYVNARPDELNSRTFVLTCTELNGRFVSNELQVTIEVSHVHHARTNAPDSANLNKIHEIQEEIPHPVRSADVNRKNSDTQTVTGIVIMCIVCTGFVVLLVILGVARIRSTQRHIHDVSVEEKQEMEWDNSALTITVNPMDQEVLCDDVYDQGTRCGDSESEDEGSVRDNEAETSDGEAEGPEKAKSKELEWDDSTLSF